MTSPRSTVSTEDAQLLWDDALTLDTVHALHTKYRDGELSDWVKSHAMHVVEHCPNVMGRVGFSTDEFCQNIAAHFDAWHEERKLALLNGYGQTKAEQYVYRSTRDKGYISLSPDWVGVPDSSLREKAVQSGWTPSFLGIQAEIGLRLEQDAPARWRSWMPYPLSCVFLYRRQMIERHPSFPGFAAEFAPIEYQTKPWDNPKDIMMAQLLMALVPTALRDTLTVHPNVDMASIGPQERAWLKSHVEVHLGLGMVDVLLQKILEGDPFVEPKKVEDNMQLPEFQP